MQLSFGDAGGKGRRKKTRHEIFLTEMGQVGQWDALLESHGLATELFEKVSRHLARKG